MTTSHSVEWDEIAVRHPGGSLTATVAGRDLATDLVLLKVPGLAAPAIRLAARTPDTGELALIVGRSWGGHLKARLTTLTRVDGPIRVGRGRTLERVLNLDTAPYTGFSGSAVVLPDGTVAGISTTGLLRGAGLALTADTIRPTLDALERHGERQAGVHRHHQPAGGHSRGAAGRAARASTACWWWAWRRRRRRPRQACWWATSS